jgi:hypothetical protein
MPTMVKPEPRDLKLEVKTEVAKPVVMNGMESYYSPITAFLTLF